LKHIILILLFLVSGLLSYSQENKVIEPPKNFNDSIIRDTLFDNNFYNYINNELIKNRLKDSLKLPENYEDFKRKFLALKLNNLPLDIGLPKAKPGTPQLLDDNYIKSFWFALNSPFSFLYYNLSKTERSRRRVYELRNEKEQYSIIDQKINRQKIQIWTSLPEKDLDAFILFCDFSFNYMLNTNEYDLILRVKEKLADFKKDDGKKRN